VGAKVELSRSGYSLGQHGLLVVIELVIATQWLLLEFRNFFKQTTVRLSNLFFKHITV
jgi:hypothetical protein